MRFWKAHSTRYTLFKLIQSWQKELDNHRFVGAVATDLSNANDFISHELLTAKLDMYRITKSSLELCLNYLSRVNYVLITVAGVPQG